MRPPAPSRRCKAVYKPARGERPLHDFPPGLHLREAAAYELSAALGWDLVPPTVVRDGPLGTGSLQLFVLADFEQHYFTLRERAELHPALRRLCGLRRGRQCHRPQGRSRAARRRRTTSGPSTTGSASTPSSSCAPCCGTSPGTRCPPTCATAWGCCAQDGPPEALAELLDPDGVRGAGRARRDAAERRPLPHRPLGQALALARGVVQGREREPNCRDSRPVHACPRRSRKPRQMMTPPLAGE